MWRGTSSIVSQGGLRGPPATYYNSQPLPEISLRGRLPRTRLKGVEGWLPAALAGLLPVLFVPVAVDAFILPRAALALVGGAGLFAAGLAWGRRSLGSLALPAASVAAAAVVAGLLSVAPNLSLVGAYGRYESAPMRLAYVGLLCGAAWLGARERTVTAFLAGCGVASVEAIGQALLGSLPRPDGNLGQPNLLGGLLAMALPLALYRSRADRRWLAVAGLLGAGLAASASRSGWLAAVAGLVALVALLVPRRLGWLATGVGVLLVLGTVLLLAATPLRNLNHDTGSARLGVWGDSVRLVAARPLFGWGEDTMGLVFGRYQTADWEPGDSFDRAHSLPLDIAAAQGVVGLASCIWLFGVWWIRVIRRPDLAGFAGAGAAYLVWALLNFDWAPATAAFWLLAGVAWPSGEPRPTPARRRPGVVAAAVVVVSLACVGSLALALSALAGDLYLYAGRPAVAARLDPLQPKYSAAVGGLEELRAAARLNDPEPAAYVALGDAEAAAGHREAARAAYRRALQMYPYYTEAHSRLR